MAMAAPNFFGYLFHSLPRIMRLFGGRLTRPTSCAKPGEETPTTIAITTGGKDHGDRTGQKELRGGI